MLSIGMASRKCSGSEPKLTALAKELCTSSSRPQPVAAMMREIQSGSLKVLPGGSISVAMFSIAGMRRRSARPSQIARRVRDGRFGARRRRQMTDLDLAGAHEGQVIRPALGRNVVDQSREPFQPRGCDLLGARQPEVDAVHVNGDLLRHQVQALPLLPVRLEIVSATTSSTSMRSSASKMPAASSGRQPSPTRSFLAAASAAPASPTAAAAAGAATAAACELPPLAAGRGQTTRSPGMPSTATRRRRTGRQPQQVARVAAGAQRCGALAQVVEQALDAREIVVAEACAVGIPDPRRDKGRDHVSTIRNSTLVRPMLNA